MDDDLKHQALGTLLSGKSLAILVLNFSPYHVARLRHIAAALQPWNARLLGIELASVDTDYPWTVDRQKETFDWHTLFENRPMNEVSHREQADAIQNLLRELQPAAVVIPGWSHGFLRGAIRWSRTNRVPHVVQSDSVRDLPVFVKNEIPRRWYLELAKRMFLRGITAAQGAGQRSVEYLAQLGVPPGRIVQKLDVVDNAYFAQVSEQVRNDADRHRSELQLPRPFFVYPSRFLPRKNQAALVDAYEIYQKAAGADGWDLVLLGSGPTQELVDAKIARLASQRVQRRSFAPMRELARYYALAEALVFPSYNETWGLIVNETAGAGRPMLLPPNVPAFEHLLEIGRNGWLVNPLDPQDIASGMLRMFDLSATERAAMGQHSQKLVESWDLKDHMDELFDALEIAFGRPRTPGRAPVLSRA